MNLKDLLESKSFLRHIQSWVHKEIQGSPLGQQERRGPRKALQDELLALQDELLVEHILEERERRKMSSQ